MSPIVTPFSANNVVNRGNFNTKLEEVNVGAAEKVHDHDERYYSQSEVNVMLAEVMSELGKKVNNLAIMTSGSIRQVLNNQSGSYVVTSAVTDMQINNVWWICSVECKPGGYCRIDATILENPSASYRTTYANGKWNKWALLAVDEPPQQVALPATMYQLQQPTLSQRTAALEAAMLAMMGGDSNV